jgi:hypothetical protein
MKIFIEGEKYPISILEKVFGDSKSYNIFNPKGIIISVGYYHSYITGEIAYLLPKVFMVDGIGTIFGVSKDALLSTDLINDFKFKNKLDWVRQLSVYFYNSLCEFKRRNIDSSVVQISYRGCLNTNLGQQEYSYLDLLLSYINFYKKNKHIILYRHIVFQSKQAVKTNWNKTISHSIPLISRKNQPIYIAHHNKKKAINSEEDLLTYFFSILNHFNKMHNLHINIDKSYQILVGLRFEQLQKNGLAKLKKIKHRYFSDTFKKMYHLCEIYFSQTDRSSLHRKKEDFILVNNYNLVFEDMVDKLLSSIDVNSDSQIKKLKYNDDGKIIDHIFDYQSLIDTSNIFYIGDSKYYKSDSEAGKISRYKQFTYAKNIIQYNVNLLNQGTCYREDIRYRDEETDGYNITPNFFVYGYIKNYKDFDNDNLYLKDNVIKSCHFENRLFDRDTLFIHQYKINFLFVLKAYTQFNSATIDDFRVRVKKTFRLNFLKYFNSSDQSKFELYEYLNHDIEQFVERNFRLLNGKCFKTNNNKLILAKHIGDKSILGVLNYFKRYKLV